MNIRFSVYLAELILQLPPVTKALHIFSHAGSFTQPASVAPQPPEPQPRYILFESHVPKDQLKHVLFPLGSLTKAHVKEIAKQAYLHNFDKKESMGICFIGKRKFEDFLPTYLE